MRAVEQRKKHGPRSGSCFTSIYLWRRIVALALAAALWLSYAAPGSGAGLCVSIASPDPPGWTLVWSDEFNGPNGSSVDAQKWTLETGGGGWGNNELQSYTNRLQNASLEHGALIIKAISERYTGIDGITRNYTSARLKTQGKLTQAYGRFEARLKIPSGQGIWPAFWMLGSDIDRVGWPRCGEIDIMENIGREPFTVHGTVHGPGYSGAAGIGAAYRLPNGERFADAYHLYAIEWEPRAIRWYVDDVLYKTITPADLPVGANWVFNHPFFLLLNVAVGGHWPSNPDATTVFPQVMMVDYVRVYQRKAAGVSAAPSSFRFLEWLHYFSLSARPLTSRRLPITLVLTTCQSTRLATRKLNMPEFFSNRPGLALLA
jgi:beta-glucanase (GH16 family)